MSKILAVARTEYAHAVRSKAFLVGILVMPIIMGGSIVMQKLLEGRVDTAERRCAVVDASGELFSALDQANQEREDYLYEYVDGEKGRQNKPRFVFELVAPPTDGQRADLELSDRVRSGDLFAFLIIDATAIGQPGPNANPLAYHTATPTYNDLPRWIERVLNRKILAARFAREGIDQELVSELNKRVDLTSLGLVSVNADGEVVEAVRENKFRTLGVPIACFALLFMLVMMSAPALLNQVLEEKMQRISEVLISAMSPFEFMMGKLVGTVMVSMTLSLLYLGAAFYLAHHFGVSDLVPLSILGWFLLFQTLAMFMFGSIFTAVGAACSEMRDAQTMMMPVMLLIMIPFFCFSVILEDPTSTFSRAASLFPIATPMLMLLRVALPPGPPLWEIALGTALCVAFTVFCVWAAGKIFRIGILSQGQAPTVGRMLRWVFSK